MLPVNVQAAIEDIRLDNTSGATSLVRRAATALALLDDLPPARIPEILAEAGAVLLTAQPAMAPMWNLVNSLLWAVEREGAGVGIACDRFLAALTAHDGAASRRLAGLISDRGTVVTHSYSGTVREALVSAWTDGRRFHVICTESRPICEGTALAGDLARSGIPVTLVIDSAMLTAIQEATLVLVGADAVSASGVTNKMGTALIAAAARLLKVPC